ncbi:SDR family oxidoreductase [Pendulispora albinea]|uniref:SDR family oxidoreductase n=1 Tax=Pendulispora albinea TaxID=2741071 RepID=A0ABZ2M0K5_9BACT
MRIDIVGKSDYFALALGSPKALKIRASEPVAPRLKNLTRAGANEPRTVLLLGATGFVGMHILYELLQRKDVAKIYALVRKKRAASPEARLTASMRGYGLPLEKSDRLEVIDGDFTHGHQFGLSDAHYTKLLGSVDVVLNAAGATNHTYPYAYFRSEAIVPLLRMMEFCATERFKTLHFIGSMNGEVFRSKRDFLRFGFYHCGYSRMKWIVKYLAVWAREQGLAASIYLPPHIVGSSLTAFKDPGLRYSFWHMVWYASQLRKVWDAEEPVPVISADALARSVCDNALLSEPRMFAYPASYISSAEFAQAFGWTVVPWKEFRAELKRTFTFSLRKWNPKKPLSSVFDMLLHMFFTRALFTNDLPDLISAITRAAQRHEPAVATELPPSRYIHECARRNYIIGRSMAAGALPSGQGEGVMALKELTRERV